MTGDIKDRKFERKEINKELTSRLLCEVRDQGKSMNAQFLFAARIPATITCSR